MYSEAAESVSEISADADRLPLFQNGESVTNGAVLADVMNSKAAAELVAPASGGLKIPVQAGTLSGSAGRRADRVSSST